MRIFIMPSWCPTHDDPLSGCFFIEQANLIASSRPDWTIGLIQFDLTASRIPYKPWKIKNFFNSSQKKQKFLRSKIQSGLYLYELWGAHIPSFFGNKRWTTNINTLALQAEWALIDFIKFFGKVVTCSIIFLGYLGIRG